MSTKENSGPSRRFQVRTAKNGENEADLPAVKLSGTLLAGPAEIISFSEVKAARRAPSSQLPEETGCAAPNGRALNIRNAASIKPEKTRWLWKGWLADGKVTLLSGAPKEGKSLIAIDAIARVTTGSPFYNDVGPNREPAHVLLLNAEDNAEDTIIPRLLAAGADLTRVAIVDSVRRDEKRELLKLDHDLDLIRTQIEEMRRSGKRVGLVVVDPVASVMGNLDPNKSSDVRKVMDPLNALAGELGVSILVIAHNTKSMENAAKNSVSGSMQWVAAARIIATLATDPDGNPDQRVLSSVGSNNSKDEGSLMLRISSKDVGDGIEAPFVVWEGVTSATADDVRAQLRQPRAERHEEAEDFLRELLSEGPVLQAVIMAQAAEQDIRKRTLERAKDELGIRAKKGSGRGAGWTWELP